MGMEMTASCESGQKCSRPTTPIISTPRYYTYHSFFNILPFLHSFQIETEEERIFSQ